DQHLQPQCHDEGDEQCHAEEVPELFQCGDDRQHHHAAEDKNGQKDIRSSCVVVQFASLQVFKDNIAFAGHFKLERADAKLVNGCFDHFLFLDPFPIDY